MANLTNQEKTQAFKVFKKKLFQLRAVSNEKDINIIIQDSLDAINYEAVGDKKYWFSANTNQRVWLDMDKYIP